MSKHLVSIARYEKPQESVRRVVDLAGGLGRIPTGARVFIKPNVVFWCKGVPFPKWGVITTSRVVEDMVHLLKERGVEDVTIGEGIVLGRADHRETAAEAFQTLGYTRLAERYGVRVINTFDRPFVKQDLGDGVVVNMNQDILESDFVIDLPVMKCHAQTVISLGIKNLKGMLDLKSRKACHNTHPTKDLHYWVSRLSDPMPPILTVQDGIFTAERGPGFDGVMHRSNLLVASWDVFAGDKVGARLLGYQAEEVPHLVHYANRHGRVLDLSDVELAGEPLESMIKPHRYYFPYNEDGSLPAAMDKMGLKGISFYKYDSTTCTYCSSVTRMVLTAIARAWKGEPWQDVEVLTGKLTKPRPGAKHTIALGKCMYQLHKDNPAIEHLIAVKGCPPQPEQILKAFHQAGVMLDPAIVVDESYMPAMFLKRYKGKPEYDERLFQVQ